MFQSLTDHLFTLRILGKNFILCPAKHHTLCIFSFSEYSNFNDYQIHLCSTITLAHEKYCSFVTTFWYEDKAQPKITFLIPQISIPSKVHPHQWYPRTLATTRPPSSSSPPTFTQLQHFSARHLCVFLSSNQVSFFVVARSASEICFSAAVSHYQTH